MKIIFLIFLASLIIGIESGWVGIERPCLCQEFRCDSGTSCLHKSRVCNGYSDCPNKEDEVGYDDGSCFKRKRVKCDPNTEFKCKFGGCIKIAQVCDGEINCIGGVDEATDFCNWVHGAENATKPEGF